MGLIKATTGQYTAVYVANTKQVKQIKVAQAVDATAGASANYANAFGSVNSILSYTEMNETPVTGKFDVIASDNNDFQTVAMGNAVGDTFDGFSLTRAINEPLYILLVERDIKTDLGYAALWLPEVNITSDGETQAIKGIKTISYALAASDKIRLPNKALIETLAVTTGTAADTAEVPVVYNGVEMLPAGMDSDGTQSYFVCDIATGEIIPKSATDGWSIAGQVITLNGTYSSVANIMVAYQY